MQGTKRFKYVDYTVSLSGARGFRHWRSVESARLPTIIGHNAPTKNCYASMQQFREPSRPDPEDPYAPWTRKDWTHTAPLFFDLDDEDEPARALDAAKAIVAYFSALEVPRTLIRVRFSGSRGFHVLIPIKVFGLTPSADLTDTIRSLAERVAADLELECVDRSVYRLPSVFRVPGTVNLKTGLYCTELRPDDLTTIEVIRALAAVPRSLAPTPERAMPVEAAVRWAITVEERARRVADVAGPRTRRLLPVLNDGTLVLPACIADVLETGVRQPRALNETVLALVGYFKNAGVEPEAAREILTEFALSKTPQGWTSKSEREIAAMVRSTVRTAYRREKYRFECAFIRALGVGAQIPVACAGEACRHVVSEDESTPLRALVEAVFQPKPTRNGCVVRARARLLDSGDGTVDLEAWDDLAHVLAGMRRGDIVECRGRAYESTWRDAAGAEHRDERFRVTSFVPGAAIPAA